MSLDPRKVDIFRLRTSSTFVWIKLCTIWVHTTRVNQQMRPPTTPGSVGAARQYWVHASQCFMAGKEDDTHFWEELKIFPINLACTPERAHRSLNMWNFLSKKERRKFVIFSHCRLIRTTAARFSRRHRVDRMGCTLIDI